MLRKEAERTCQGTAPVKFRQVHTNVDAHACVCLARIHLRACASMQVDEQAKRRAGRQVGRPGRSPYGHVKGGER